jgi:predicted PurR-regulated permease PerM
VLLGMTAFVFNFVPTVGSILAAVPAILLSLVIYGSPGHALAVAGGYLTVNMILGNIVEPKLQGARLGLSTVVVVLSLLFWGWAWGPIGALLSVPLTTMLKIWLENTKDLRWVAVLLDAKAPVGPPPAGPSPGAA